MIKLDCWYIQSITLRRVLVFIIIQGIRRGRISTIDDCTIGSRGAALWDLGGGTAAPYI